MLEERSNTSATFCRRHLLGATILVTVIRLRSSSFTSNHKLYEWGEHPIVVLHVTLQSSLWSRPAPASAASFTWKRTFGRKATCHFQPRMKESSSRSCLSPPSMHPSSQWGWISQGNHPLGPFLRILDMFDELSGALALSSAAAIIVQVKSQRRQQTVG